MNDRNRAVNGLQTAEDRKHNRMVTTERKDTRMRPAICGTMINIQKKIYQLCYLEPT